MYYVGIDGGGTKTLACILDDKGRVISTGISGPSSIDTVDISVTICNIDEAIRNAFLKRKLDVEHIESIFIGLGGVACVDDERFVATNVQTLEYAKNSLIKVKNDVYNALAGGLATRNGMAIILGTGSVCFGENGKGDSHRAGGIHYKEGDAGSAYDLGRQALKSLARAMDKRIEMTSFNKAVAQELNVNTFKELVIIFDKLFTDRTQTASLAKIVTKYANEGDLNALDIVQKATDEAALLVRTVLHQVEFTSEEKILAIIGSLVNSSGKYNELFIEKVVGYDAEIKVVKPMLDPAVGSALMAYKLAGHLVSDELIEENKIIEL